jgi:hypothetical protein
LYEKGASNVIDGAYGALGFAILLGCVWAGKTKVNAVGGEEVRNGGVEEFSAIVSLHRNYMKVKLSACIGNEVEDSTGYVGFPMKRKGPHVVGIVINYNKIVFKARITKNERCPQITMY